MLLLIILVTCVLVSVLSFGAADLAVLLQTIRRPRISGNPKFYWWFDVLGNSTGNYTD